METYYLILGYFRKALLINIFERTSEAKGGKSFMDIGGRAFPLGNSSCKDSENEASHDYCRNNKEAGTVEWSDLMEE